jgi:tetratricopeptide (TPR) repeat protein
VEGLRALAEVRGLQGLNEEAGSLKARGDKIVVDQIASAGWGENTLAQAQNAIDTLVRGLGANHPDVAKGLTVLARCQSNRGAYVEAEESLKRALEIWETAEQSSQPEIGRINDALSQLAELYAEQNQNEKAIRWYERVLARQEGTYGADHPKVAATLSSLGEAFLIQEKYPEAEQFYQRALAIDEEKLGPDHPSVLVSLLNLSLICVLTERYDEAMVFMERGTKICDRLGEGPNVAQVRHQFEQLKGMALSQTKSSADA